MAEFVQFRAEEWASELAQMERIRLFEPNELKTIVRKRKEFEYKIQRRTKVMEDYLKYIQFEIDLHRIIKARRKKNRIKENKKEIDFSQTRRIGNLFKFALQKFPNDIKLWMSFFKFCEGVKFYSLVSQMLVRMLQIHSNKPELWVFAAKWEFKQCDSIATARQFLTRGLRHHPSNPLLYKELFALELENRLQLCLEVKQKKVTQNMLGKVNRRIMKGKVAEVIYDLALKEIKDVEFKAEMYDIAVTKKAPSALKYKILKSMVVNHLDEELTWNVAAQVKMALFPMRFRNWIEEMKSIEEEGNVGKRKNEEDVDVVQEKRLKMDVDEEKKEKGMIETENNKEKDENQKKQKEGMIEIKNSEENQEDQEENDCKEGNKKETEVEIESNKEKKKMEELEEIKRMKSLSTKDKIQISIDLYEKAVKKFNSVKMWSYYLDFVIELNGKLDNLKVFKTKLFNNAMEGAMKCGKLSEKHYIIWIQNLQKTKKKPINFPELLKKATEDHPKSLKLWYARLKYSLIQNPETDGLEIFHKAIDNIPDEASLWSLAVKHLLLKSSPKTEEILQKGIKRGGEVAQILKPFYVEWVAKTKGITEARNVFESAEMNLYPCLELYKKMADIEMNEDQPCLEKVRRCHDLACKHFGGDDPVVWLDYIKFELKHGDISKVSKIHGRALKHLKPEPADEFLVEYNKFKMDVST